jgi:uncharacterized protein YktA (UPF0223 family)
MTEYPLIDKSIMEAEIAESKQRRELAAEIDFFKDVIGFYQAGIDVTPLIKRYLEIKQEQLKQFNPLEKPEEPRLPRVADGDVIWTRKKKSR